MSAYNQTSTEVINAYERVLRLSLNGIFIMMASRSAPFIVDSFSTDRSWQHGLMRLIGQWVIRFFIDCRTPDNARPEEYRNSGNERDGSGTAAAGTRCPNQNFELGDREIRRPQ